MTPAPAVRPSPDTDRPDDAGRPGPESRPARWSTAVTAAAWVVVATVLQLFRNSGAPAYDVIWAEDGTIFLTDALTRSTPAALVEPYAGYLHVAPRLVAEVVALFPVVRAAFLLAGAAAVSVALLSLYVYWASARIIPSAWARASLAGLVVLLPAAGYETNAAVNDLHWYLLFACAVAFAAAPEDRRGVAAACVVAGLTALSDPLCALLLPLALVGSRHRSRAAWAAPATAVAGLAVQAVAVLVSYQPSIYGEVVAADIPRVYGLRVAGSFLVGDRSLDRLAGLGPTPVAYGCALVVALLLVGVALRAPGARVWVAAFAGCSVLLLAVPVGLRGTEEFFPGVFTLNGSRYTVLPILLLYTALLAGLGRRWPGPTGSLQRRTAARLFLLWVGALVVLNHGVQSVRDFGPGWLSSLATARQVCADAGGAPAGLPGEVPAGPGQVRVPVAPNVGPPHPATVVVPCGRLG